MGFEFEFFVMFRHNISQCMDFWEWILASNKSTKSKSSEKYIPKLYYKVLQILIYIVLNKAKSVLPNEEK